MDDVSTFVFDFFMERHIVLREAWISDVITFLVSYLGNKVGDILRNPNRVAGLIYEQWKHADIAVSTFPLLKQLSVTMKTTKTFIKQPVVLQIESIVDIGASYYSQFSALMYEFVDNSGFDPLPEMERGVTVDNFDAKNRRMLSLTVSDGETVLRAVEYYSIKSLSLLVKPGSKTSRDQYGTFLVLASPNLLWLSLCEQRRQGTWLIQDAKLRKRLVFASAYASGDVQKGCPFPEAWERAVVRRRPNDGNISRLPLDPSKLRTEVEGEVLSVGNMHTDAKMKDISVDICDDEDRQLARPSAREAMEDFEESEFHEDYEQSSSALPQELCSSTSCSVNGASAGNLRVYSKPVAQISPMKAAEPELEEQAPEVPSIELEESPPDFESVLARLHTSDKTHSSSTLSPDLTPKTARICKGRIFRDGISSRHGSIVGSVSRKRISDASTCNRGSLLSLCESQSETSSLKQMPPTLFDPTRRPIKLGLQSYLTSPPPNGKMQDSRDDNSARILTKKVKIEVVDLDDEDDIKPIIKASPSEQSTSCHSQTDTTENDFVARFRKLNIVRLVEASRQMRFAVGSCKKSVQAVIMDIVDSLRIVDGMWTMKVALHDESTGSFSCLIDCPTLTSLIGLTPAQAMEVRASSDVERRKDGQRRLGAVEEQLKRLDLVFEVELFSGGRADPVIRSIRTLMQALDAQ